MDANANGRFFPRRRPLGGGAGIFGVGHATYWDQFGGLREELLRYMDDFERTVAEEGLETVNFGMVDDARSAQAAARTIQAADIDILFCDMLTYAPAATWGPIMQAAAVPVVLVALQPLSALDYSMASTRMQLANDNICALPEFASIAARAGRAVPPMIIGTLHDDPAAREELSRWCGVARVLHDVRGARIGQMGHVLEGMLDMHTDASAFTTQLGVHVVQTEIDDLLCLWRDVTEPEIEAKTGEILRMFQTPDPRSDPLTRKLTPDDLEPAARAAVALDRFVDEFDLDGLAYYYEGEPGSEQARLASSLIVGNSMLCAAGFPMCGELDLKTCLAMLIMDRLDIGGSFAEFHPIDFNEGFILVGHDGPHHVKIAEGRPVLRSLVKYHGKPGAGASVEFKIKEGPISMLGVTQTGHGRFKFVVAEGESVRGPIPSTGNTNTRGFFEPDPVTFLQRWLAEGPTHHFALGVGHHAESLRRVGRALGVDTVVVP